jgi:hypothetical protein
LAVTVAWANVTSPDVVKRRESLVTGLPAPSLTVALTVTVDVPLDTTAGLERLTTTVGAAPLTNVRSAVPDRFALVSWAVIVCCPGVVELMTVLVARPYTSVVADAGVKVTLPLLEKATGSPGTGLLCASSTVATKLDWLKPSAGTSVGLKVTCTAIGGPGTSVRRADPVTPWSVADMTSGPAVVDAVSVVVAIPAPLVRDELGLNDTSPLVANVTKSPARALPWTSVTVALTCEVDVLSAVITGGASDTVNRAGGPAVSVNSAVAGPTPGVFAVIVSVPEVVWEVIIAE